MTYLELCKELRLQAGISGNGPDSVENQTGQLGRVTNWINQAWADLQRSRTEWKFMKVDFTFDTVADKRDYTPSEVGVTNMRDWDKYSFYIFHTADGEETESGLPYMSYELWRNTYRSQMNVRELARPGRFTVLRDDSIRFESSPDDIYTINGEYKRCTCQMAVNDDEPTGLPEEFHMIIVWKALMYYASYENAPEVMDEAEVAYDELLFALEQDQLPDFDDDHISLVPGSTSSIGG